MPRIGSRIRTVAPAFPSQGPANVAGMLVGTVVQPRRVGRNPIVRSRALLASASLVDRPEPAMVIRAPQDLPPAAAATSSSTDGCSDCG